MVFCRFCAQPPHQPCACLAFARSRHTNPARGPVGNSAGWCRSKQEALMSISGISAASSAAYIQQAQNSGQVGAGTQTTVPQAASAPVAGTAQAPGTLQQASEADHARPRVWRREVRPRHAAAEVSFSESGSAACRIRVHPKRRRRDHGRWRSIQRIRQSRARTKSARGGMA